MNLKEFLQDVDIWEEIKKVEPFDFINDTKIFNLHLIINHGEKKVYYKYLYLQILDIVNIIVTVYKYKWNKIVDISKLDYNIGASSTNKYNEKYNYDDNYKENTNKVINISAYDSSNMIEDSKDVFDKTTDNSKKSDREYINEKISIDDVYKNLSIIDKNNIITIVNYDISKIITNNIYC